MSVLICSGVIASGKSTLTTMLAKELGTTPFYESVEDNPVLPLFYKDPNKYTFLLQIYFLNTRFKSIKEAMKEDNNVLDRSIYEDEIFMRMNADMGRATETEWTVYKALLENMMQELPFAAHKKRPDLLIHIKVSLPTMLKRINKRGREYEQLKNDPTLVDYYASLIRYYEDWYEKYDESPKILIDGDKYDFVENEDDRKVVLGMIKHKIGKIEAVPAL